MENMKKTAVRVTVVTIIVNVALSAIKLLAGIIAKSGRMVYNSYFQFFTENFYTY